MARALSPASLLPTSSQAAALKWIALVLMTGDHVSTFLFDGRLWALNAAGRAVFPLFALLMARNAAAVPGALDRYLPRLLLAGFVAVPATWALRHVVYFNVMFTFAFGLIFLRALERDWGNRLAAIAGILTTGAILLYASLLTEFGAAGVLLVAASCAWARSASPAAGLVALATLALINGLAWDTPYAGLALAIWAAAKLWDMRAPRGPTWFFYGWYPAQFAAFAVLRAVL